MLETFQILKELLEERLSNVFAQLEQIVQHYTPEEGLSVNVGTVTRIWESLRRDTFQIMMLGHFSSGKSTLLNALIGYLPLEDYVQDAELKETLNELGVLPISDLPTTPVITYITYAEYPRVLVQSLSTKQWREKTLDWYLQEVRVRASAAENARIFADIAQVHLQLPVPLCQAGITLVDVPGIENSTEHNLLVDQALESSDTAIVLLRSDQLATLTERKYLSKLRDSGMASYFTVINLFDKRRVDLDLKARTWERLVREMSPTQSIPPYDGRDLTSKHIYFVDALRAQKAKFTADQKLLKASGLPVFEEQLADFLQNERFYIHVTRFIDETVAVIEKLLNDTTQMTARILTKRDVLETQLQNTRAGRASDNARMSAERQRYEREIRELNQKKEQIQSDTQDLTAVILALQDAEGTIRQAIWEADNPLDR